MLTQLMKINKTFYEYFRVWNKYVTGNVIDHIPSCHYNIVALAWYRVCIVVTYLTFPSQLYRPHVNVHNQT